MNLIDMSILDMYFNEGMKETEIAESLSLSVLDVHEALCAFETGRLDIHPDLIEQENEQ